MDNEPLQNNKSKEKNELIERERLTCLVGYLKIIFIDNKTQSFQEFHTISLLIDSFLAIIPSDDLNNEFGGSYFKIHKVLATGNVLNSADTYEIDIGYPGDNLVTSFNITDNNSWALLYDYAQKIDINNYVYTIDKNEDNKSK